jgi:hypothetical protein
MVIKTLIETGIEVWHNLLKNQGENTSKMATFA